MTHTLHCVAPVFRLIKRIRNSGLTFKLCQNLTFLFIFWPLFWQGDHWVLMKVITSFTKFHFLCWRFLTATAYQTLKYKCTCVMCQERKLKKLTQTHQLQICIFLPPKFSFKHRWMLNGNFKTLLDILTE